MSSIEEDDIRKVLAGAADTLTWAVQDFLAEPEQNGTIGDKSQRRNIIEAAYRIIETVKDPADQWLDITNQVSLFTANRLFWEWGVFDEIPSEGSISYKELSEKVKVEESLLSRIGAVIVSNLVLEQIGVDCVAHTSKSLIFTKGDRAGLVYQMAWDNGLKVYAGMPQYFEAYGRNEPQTMNHIPNTYAHGHPEWSVYEMLSHYPDRLNRFMRAMAMIEEKMPISGIYDFSSVIERGLEQPERPIFVDVGGGRGQAIKAIRGEYPSLRIDRCVLQDRPEVLEAMKSLDDHDLRGVQTMAIDFHQEQPLKGAIVYWIRRCLHNYSDSVSINILKKIAEAMADDSKLLIEEDIMDTSPGALATSLDLIMLGFGGKERTLECWNQLLSAAGLKSSSISKGRGLWKTLAVIECVKVGI